MFYLINKPVGMTSFQVIRELRKKLNIKKMGHVGTLDPLASGLMLIATEQSTKLLSFLNGDKKGYIFRTELDGSTESLDLETEIIPSDISNLKIPTTNILETNLIKIKSQIPPKFSAIHINGQRAYKLARKDRDFNIPHRNIIVYHAKILDIKNTSITTEIIISSGGYIRSFAPEIAKWCNVTGGYVSLLTRNKLFFENVELSLDDAQNLDNFDPKKSIPEEQLFTHFDHINIENHALEELIKNGIPPNKQQLPKITKEYLFLIFSSGYASLLKQENNSFKIIKNDVKSKLL